ncbi:MAG: peptide chain release factor 2 [Oscillospiraceae bacterium]|nr:peptide chain release factor 2 [Oscillospiraceae bacterium]
MLIYEELLQKLKELKPQIDNLNEALNLKEAEALVKKLEEESSKEDFWSDLQHSQKVLQEIKANKDKIAAFNSLLSEYDDAEAMIEIADGEEDESYVPEISESIAKLEKDISEQRLATLLNGEYDANNTILTFHAGAGGTEAQDWASMLYRMYTRWAERHGFKYKILDYLDGDEAGIKSASILIEGYNAYGYLKSEVGVHRLVRISPFDASGRRHTSFASLEVMPEIPDDVEIDIRPEDIKVDTYRSSGAGGQHVNKTESAIRITHLPTGIIVACQNERSQHQNREVAMKMLRSKLVEIKEREHLEKIEDIKGVQKEIAWGNQIRSYVFMPYTLVKDHRTSFENGNVSAVMDGDLDGFINAYLVALSQGKIIR